MAYANPKGRANYEPNSWPQPDSGPRENPDRGFYSVPTEETGPKRRIRPESFADHYSQAELFYASQTPVEQQHIANAFAFELGKVETPTIRLRMLANLRNVDEELAAKVADGLGLELPPPSTPARPRVDGLAPSPALSIVGNGPARFTGRKLGVLVSDGTDAKLVRAVRDAAEREGAMVDVVAPTVGGVALTDRSTLVADHAVPGGPSVLFDAVAVLVSAEGAALMATDPAAKDFVSDAYAHAKFVAYAPGAAALLQAAGVQPDAGFVELRTPGDAKRFLELCRTLRYWDREKPPPVKPVASRGNGRAARTPAKAAAKRAPVKAVAKRR
jgi:catalase